MQVREKTRHIDVTIQGDGVDQIVDVLRRFFPDVQIQDDDDDLVAWKDTPLSAEIRAAKTPGKILRAYRERAGLTLVQLAQEIGTQYTNISAMENDRRRIGHAMAYRIGKVLGVDPLKFVSE